MFKNTYQNGLLSIFYSCGSNPLAIWDMEVHNGHIKRVTDNEVNSIVLEIVSTNVATTFITCPKNNQVLSIKLPFLVMIVKNLKRYFSFEITVLDNKNMRRRFRISNFQSTTKIRPFCTTMPIGLSGGWNQIQFNLSDFTRRAYGSQFVETLRVQIHANTRVRRIYFADRLYTEEELPQDYKLYLPLERKPKKKADKKTELKAAAPSKAASEGAEEKKEDAPPEGAQGEEAAPKDEAKPEEGKEGTPAETPAEGEAKEPAGEAAESEPATEGEAVEAEGAQGEAKEPSEPVEGGEAPSEAAESDAPTPTEAAEAPAATEGDAPPAEQPAAEPAAEPTAAAEPAPAAAEAPAE